MSQTKVFLKPTEKLLEKVIGLHTAIDTLVHNDCFQENNTMRSEPNGVLFWNWAILEVCGERIPVPYHTTEGDQSVLYDWQFTPVFMTNEQCVYTNAKFFLSYLWQITDFAKKNEIHPMYGMLMNDGFKWIEKIGQDKFFKIMSAVEDKIDGQGWKVLN